MSKQRSKSSRIKSTTTIRIHGEDWRVPRGFGRIYRDVVHADDSTLAGPRGPGMIIDRTIRLLELIGYTATREQVADWPRLRRTEAVVYAMTVHARAGDNPVQRHPMPAWLEGVKPWQGPPVRSTLKGMDYPALTPLPAEEVTHG